MSNSANAAARSLSEQLHAGQELPSGHAHTREPEITPAEDVSLDSVQGAQAIEMTQTAPHEPTAADSPTSQSTHSSPIEEMQAPQPANHAMSGSFYLRHPKLTKALGRLAAVAAFVTTVVPLTIAYGLASPVRMFYLLANTVSPSLADKLFKNDHFRHLVGPFIEGSLSSQTDSTDSEIRAESGALLTMDLGTGGAFLAAGNGTVRAYELARDIQQRTNSRLGFSQVIEETVAIQTVAAEAKPLHQNINQWFDILGDETPKTGLDENVWKNLEKKFTPPSPSANSLSLLLESMLNGMPTNFEKSEDPAVNHQRQIAKMDFRSFVNDRLLPVLTNIQNSEKVAQKAFELAEIGLGACSDRAVFGWMAVELGTQSTKYTEQYLQLGTADKESGSKKRAALLTKLVQVEAQKFTLNEAKRHADLLLHNHQRSKWMENPRQLLPYDRLDVVECYLALCKRVQERLLPSSIQWYPKIPYALFASGLSEIDLQRGSKRIVRHVDQIWNDKTNAALLNHLQFTDSWQEILAVTCPHNDSMKATQLKTCTDALSHLDNIHDTMGEDYVGNEFQVAATAIGSLYKKFNGDQIDLEINSQPLDKFIPQQIRLCNPVFVQANKYSEYVESIREQTQELQSLVAEMKASSPAFSEALNEAKRTHIMPVEKPEYTAESLESICRDLGATKTRIEELESKGNISTDSLRKIADEAIRKHDKKLLDAIMFSPTIIDGHKVLLDSLPHFNHALEVISSMDKTAWEKTESKRKTFTLASINAFKNHIDKLTADAVRSTPLSNRFPIRRGSSLSY